MIQISFVITRTTEKKAKDMRLLINHAGYTELNSGFVQKLVTDWKAFTSQYDTPGVRSVELIALDRPWRVHLYSDGTHSVVWIFEERTWKVVGSSTGVHETAESALRQAIIQAGGFKSWRRSIA